MPKTKDMNRTQLINKLARHAHPSWFHSLLEWEDHQLAALLAYYRGEIKQLPSGLGRIYKSKGLGDTPNPHATEVVLGIDWGSPDGDVMVVAIVRR